MKSLNWNIQSKSYIFQPSTRLLKSPKKLEENMKFVSLFVLMSMLTQSVFATTAPSRSFGCEGSVEDEGVKVILNQYRTGGLTEYFHFEIGSSRGTFNRQISYVPNLEYVKRDTESELLVKEHREDITVFLQLEQVQSGEFPAQIILKQGNYHFYAHLNCGLQ